MKKLFSLKKEPEFTVEKDLVAGMELAVSGQKISWTIDNYLLSLRESVEDLIKPGKKHHPFSGCCGKRGCLIERPFPVRQEAFEEGADVRSSR